MKNFFPPTEIISLILNVFIGNDFFEYFGINEIDRRILLKIIPREYFMKIDNFEFDKKIKELRLSDNALGPEAAEGYCHPYKGRQEESRRVSCHIHRPLWRDDRREQ